jgi:hypothetical protein
MARPKKEEKEIVQVNDDSDDIAKQLIKDINKDFGVRMAYNLSDNTACKTMDIISIIVA